MNITITMAKTMDKFTKKFLSHSLKGPKTVERRGEYDRKKNGDKKESNHTSNNIFWIMYHCQDDCCSKCHCHHCDQGPYI